VHLCGKTSASVNRVSQSKEEPHMPRLSALPGWTGRTLAVLAGVAACLTLTAATPAQTPAPPITLGPVTVGDGLATVSGTVGGTPTATANVTVNGQPLGVDAGGTFAGTVNLSGQSAVTVRLTDPSGQAFSLNIPLTLAGPGGVISPSVLDALRNAGVSITIPPGGLRILDGNPLTITGSVARPGELASLTVNGQPVQPGSSGSNRSSGSDGSFSQTLPGSTREVTVVATDRQGVSQTSTFPVEQLTSTIRTVAGTSVSALGARGLRIASVRYVTKGVKTKKRMSAIVTLRDTRNFLVRDAIVRMRAASFQSRAILGGQQVKLSNRIGRATFVLKLRPKSFAKAKRLFTVTTARTPAATARKQTSVRVPRLLTRRSGR
jgi:hypothetical protein